MAGIVAMISAVRVDAAVVASTNAASAFVTASVNASMLTFVSVVMMFVCFLSVADYIGCPSDIGRIAYLEARRQAFEVSIFSMAGIHDLSSAPMKSHAHEVIAGEPIAHDRSYIRLSVRDLRGCN